MQPQARRVTSIPGIGQPVQTTAPGEVGRVPVTQRPVITFPGDIIFDNQLAPGGMGADTVYIVDVPGILNRRCDGFHLYTWNEGGESQNVYFSINNGGWREIALNTIIDNQSLDIRGCEIQDLKIRLHGLVKVWVQLYGY
jgi:hypothetical protein